MKFIDFLFYNICKWYDKEGTFRKSNDPSVRGAFLIGLCVGGWFIFMAYCFYMIIIKKPFPEYLKYYVILIVLISSGLFQQHFNISFYNNLSKKYKENHIPYPLIKYPIFFSFLFIFLPYIFFFLIAIFRFWK